MIEHTLDSEGISREPKRRVELDGEEATAFGDGGDQTPRLVTLLTTIDVVEAELTAGWLTSNGVPCIVSGAHLAGAVFGSMFEPMRMRLLVPEDRIEEAREFVEILKAGDNLSLTELVEE